MQEEVMQGNKRLNRFFLIFNFSWLVVSIVSLAYSAIETFIEHPGYLHDWHALVISLLSLLVLAFFGALPFLSLKRRDHMKWPPARSFALPYWAGIFLTVTLLTVLDNNFVWAYFVVMGLTFAIFDGKVSPALVALLFLAYCWFLGWLSWPFTGDHLSAIFGMSITFASISLMSITIQRLISERMGREHLLQQLTRSNEELEEAHHRLAESALQEQELAVLRERTRLAREMHDTLGHALVLVSVKLEVAQRLREVDTARCAQELEDTKEIVRSSMNELRASIANLRSPALEREPACRALSRYAREMAQRADLRVSYDLHPDIEGLPEETEETLWKVGQEALANIEKHARARNILLHISRQNGQIILKISDDGVGLPADLCQQGQANSYQSPGGHYGLSGMLERVKNVQGHLCIDTEPGQGTSIEVTLPLVEEPSPALSPVSVSRTPILAPCSE
ncbi:MAG TPA: sensor histidine kinase [Ktedonobacteraceae bacterium]